MELLSFCHHQSTNLPASVWIFFAFPPVISQEGHLLYPPVSLFRCTLDPIYSYSLQSSGQQTFFVKVQIIKVLGFVGHAFTHNNARLLM